MSRVDYSEEEDFPGQWELQRANFERHLAGERGQSALRELQEALLSLPEKRLIADRGTKDGEVCVVACLAVHKRVTLGQLREQALKELEAEERQYLGDDYDDPEYGGDDHWTEDLGVSIGLSHQLSWWLVFLNDVEMDHFTPEQRYEKILAWVQKRIRPAKRGAP